MLWRPKKYCLYLPGLGIDDETLSIFYTKLLQSRKLLFSGSSGIRHLPDVAHLVLTNAGCAVQIYNGS